MIFVTRLDGGPLVVNAEFILTIESTPDTALALINGDKLFVRETPDDVMARILAYRRGGPGGAAAAARWRADGL